MFQLSFSSPSISIEIVFSTQDVRSPGEIHTEGFGVILGQKLEPLLVMIVALQSFTTTPSVILEHIFNIRILLHETVLPSNKALKVFCLHGISFAGDIPDVHAKAAVVWVFLDIAYRKQVECRWENIWDTELRREADCGRDIRDDEMCGRLSYV
jgi:hypothetical protein